MISPVFPALFSNHAPAGSQIDNVEVHLRTLRDPLCTFGFRGATIVQGVRAPRRDGRLGFSSRRLIVYNVEWDR